MSETTSTTGKEGSVDFPLSGDEKYITSRDFSGNFKGEEKPNIEKLRDRVEENMREVKELGKIVKENTEQTARNVSKIEKQDEIMRIGYLVIVITMLGVAVSFLSMAIQFASFVIDHSLKDVVGVYENRVWLRDMFLYVLKSII